MELSKKNIFLAVFAIIVLIGAVTLVILINTRKAAEPPQQTKSETGQNIPALPETQISPSPDLAAVKKNTQDELTKVQSSGSRISEKNFKDASGRAISLDDFAKANGIKFEDGVLSSSSQKDYATFFCAKEKGERPATGIMIQLRRDVDPKKYQQQYSEMEKNMKNWEKSIFQDLSPLFFPEESFKKEPVFGETKYSTSNKANIIPIRFANLVADSGKQYSIDWGFLNDQIFVSNDKDCLRRELDNNADAYEP